MSSPFKPSPLPKDQARQCEQMDHAALSPHQAVASMSIMPFHIKMASISTSAKALQKVALDNNLMNELEGATITEEDMSYSKTHYMLHFYIAIWTWRVSEPSKMKTHNSTPLYDQQSKQWHPSPLSHILHTLSAHASCSSVQATRKDLKGHLAYLSKPTSVVKENRKCIMRAIEGLLLLQETEEGTLLPRPGSEEKKSSRMV